MDWVSGIQAAIDYMEQNLSEDFAYEEIARQSFSSTYHFCRVFSILCGYTPGEYLRKRRLSRAGEDVVQTDEKIIDIALKYGYESPDGFTKAFSRFHGVTPSAAREQGRRLRQFSRLTLKLSFQGGDESGDDRFRIEKKAAFTVVGCTLACRGAVSDDMHRKKQLHDFMVSGEVRFVRYALQAMARNCCLEYGVISDITDDGYSFTIGSVIPSYFVNHLKKTVGAENAKKLTVITIPESTYAILETERSIGAYDEYADLRRKLVAEQIPQQYTIVPSPEITVFYHDHDNKPKSYIEQWIPIE